MQIKRIGVLGAGTMGAQISVQIASYGYEISLFAPNPERFWKRLQSLRGLLRSTGRITRAAVAKWEKKAERVQLCQDLKKVVAEADLVIEALPEELALKRKMFGRIESMAPPHAILSTTSSSIPISWIEDTIRKKERCLNLHFYQPTLLINMVDIMAGRQTAAEVMEAARKFVRSIGCVPLLVKKEILGFCFARLLHSIYRHALYLWAGGYVDFRDIDRAWMVFTQMHQGPFGLMDAVGLDVLHDLLMVYYGESKNPQDHPPQALKDMIDRKELGRKTGKGFYAYPDPDYARPDFLKR